MKDYGWVDMNKVVKVVFWAFLIGFVLGVIGGVMYVH